MKLHVAHRDSPRFLVKWRFIFICVIKHDHVSLCFGFVAVAQLSKITVFIQFLYKFEVWLQGHHTRQVFSENHGERESQTSLRYEGTLGSSTWL